MHIRKTDATCASLIDLPQDKHKRCQGCAT
jgi:hypothetical protein